MYEEYAKQSNIFIYNTVKIVREEDKIKYDYNVLHEVQI